MPKFNHAFDFAVEVVSEQEDGEDVTAAQLRAALIARANALSDAEMMEACGLFDTYAIEQVFIVEVAAIVDFEDLEPADRAEDGTCGVDGMYAVRAADEAAALERFTAEVEIANPYDFSITVRQGSETDIDGTLRKVL